MAEAKPDINGGLRVARQDGQHGWSVIHEQSGKRIGPPLRLQAHARKARAALLELDIDFTQNRTALRKPAVARQIVASYLASARKLADR
jgi:hypothetical protein